MTALRFPMLVLLVVALAACGGAPASDPAAGGGDAATPSPDATDTTDAGDDGSGDGSDGGPTGDFNLCDVLSADEVSDIAGAEVAETMPADLQGVYSCNYLGADDAAIAGTTLALSAGEISAADLFRANESAEGSEPVDGLGDGAVMTGDENFPVLMVLVDDALYSLSVLADNLDGAGKREATIEMARQSVDRLP
jgi:hypothetical protein